MNKKKLYIHIGTHKTGSTTIQNVLKKKENELLGEGIFYMDRFFALSRKMRTMMEADEEIVKNFRQQVRDKIKESEENTPHTFVISNEKFSGHKMIVYKNAGVIAETLRDVFEPFHFDIKIIVYLRRQDRFFESMYAQKVKSGASYTFREFLDHVEDPTAYHWDLFLDTFANVFGKRNMVVRSFDKKYLPEKNSLIRDFGSIINSNYLKNYSVPTVNNRGYSRDILEIARLNNKYLEKKQKKVLRSMLTEVNLPKGNVSFFTIEERKKLLLNYEMSNRRVATEYLNDPGGELFSMPDYQQNELKSDYEGLTPEAVALSLAKTILVLNRQVSEKIEKNRNMHLLSRISRKLRKIIKKM